MERTGPCPNCGVVLDDTGFSVVANAGTDGKQVEIGVPGRAPTLQLAAWARVCVEAAEENDAGPDPSIAELVLPILEELNAWRIRHDRSLKASEVASLCELHGIPSDLSKQAVAGLMKEIIVGALAAWERSHE